MRHRLAGRVGVQRDHETRCRTPARSIARGSRSCESLDRSRSYQSNWSSSGLRSSSSRGSLHRDMRLSRVSAEPEPVASPHCAWHQPTRVTVIGGIRLKLRAQSIVCAPAISKPWQRPHSKQPVLGRSSLLRTRAPRQCRRVASKAAAVAPDSVAEACPSSSSLIADECWSEQALRDSFLQRGSPFGSNAHVQTSAAIRCIRESRLVRSRRGRPEPPRTPLKPQPAAMLASL